MEKLMPRRSVRIGILLLAFLFPVCVAIEKWFNIDEFAYVHWGWLIRQGQRVGVDFFVTHFPLIGAVTSLPFWALGSDPAAIFYARLLMVPLFGCVCFAAYCINSHVSSIAGFLAPIFLCGNAVLILSITEIRPDSLAIALFLAASGILLSGGKRPAAIAFSSGILFVLSILSSEKTLVYCPAILFACWVKLQIAAPEERKKTTLNLSVAAVGAAVSILITTIYILHAHSLSFWLDQWLPYAKLHEHSYPGSRWAGLRLLASVCLYEPVLTLFAAWTLIRVMHRRQNARNRCFYFHPVLAFLVAFLATGGLSLVIQKFPFRYSEIPFAVALSLLAAVGVAYVGEDLQAISKGRARTLWVSSLAASMVLFAASNIWAEIKMAERGNSQQLQTLRLLGKISLPSDCVYDNSGGAIARPHADDRLYQTDQVIRIVQAGRLQHDIPLAIYERGCVLLLQDIRNGGLPVPLQQFLADNYLPYTDDISVWGRTFTAANDSERTASFTAVSSGTYFVWPSEAVATMNLVVDGTTPKSQTAFLAKGNHVLEFKGPGTFSLLWLPRNTQPFEPRKTIHPRFSSGR
jgi:hypothetical protein